MRILVIGGTRFIGPYVVRRLSEMGHEVIVFHRGQTEAELPPEVRHIHHGPVKLGDRRHFLDFSDKFKHLAPDVVLDMIPGTEQDAQTLMRTFKGVARRVVAISSEDVYRAYGRLHRTEPGPPDPVPLAEDAPLREKLYPYRTTPPRKPDDPERWIDHYEKIRVERVVMSDPELPGTVLRLPMVYGPRDTGGHRTFKYLKRMDDGRPVIPLDEAQAQWRWSRGYVEDVAFAITLAVVNERAAGRIYNVAEAEALSGEAWVRHIARAAGWNGKIVIVPTGLLPIESDLSQHWVVDTTSIRQELGYTEIAPLEEAFRRTIAWQRAHPPKEIDPSEFDYAAEDAILAGLE